MRQKTRIFIYILIAIAVVIMGTLAILGNHNADTAVSAQEHIDLGRIYLVELSYEKAVLEFTEAIEIEPLNADAYLGLAETYAGMGDIEKAIDVLEEGYEKTGDERLKNMLGELLPPPEETTTVSTAAIEAAVETTSETIVDAETEFSEYMVETNPNKIYDTNASYTIDVINEKEAHIEIFSKIINDEYEIGYIPELNHDTYMVSLVLFRLNLDNICIRFDLPNFPDYFESYKTWTWNDWNIINSYYGTCALMMHDEDGYYKNFIEFEQYDFQWYILPECDLSQNKLSFDVGIPQDFDFSFNNYSNAELTVYYYEQ